MSHLQRLAERALGQTRPLRALAPQRLLGEEAPVQLDAPMAPLPRQVVRPETMDPIRHAPHSTETPRQPPHAHPDGINDPVVQAASSRTVAASTRHPDALPSAAPLQAHHTAVRADGNGATSSSLPRETLPLMAMQPLHRAIQTLAQPRPPAHHAEDPLSGSDEAPQDRPDVRTPAPLLPAAEHHAHRQAPHLALRTGQEQAASRQPAGAVEETTEVHVTIGRIEVTAVQETPSQKPATRRRPAPMSLDDYIARRQGGRT